MEFIKYSCEMFVDVLASKEPTPGGGGASALVGASGVALGHMVGELTVGKKKYADVEEEIKRLMVESEELQSQLLQLVQKDAESFEPLVKAYRLPKNTEEQRIEKERIVEQELRNACEVPFEIMEKCAEGIKLCNEFAKKGSVMATSDAGAGAIFCKAALQSASLNVYINTKSMKDREYAEKLNAKADALIREYSEKADMMIKQIFESMR